MDFLRAELRRLTAEEEQQKRAYQGGRADLQEIWDKLVSLRTFINKFETEIESAKIEDIMRGVGSVEAMNYIQPSRSANTSMTVNSAGRVADINKLKEKLRMKEVLKGRVAVLEEKIIEGRRHIAKCSDAMKQGAVNYTLSIDQYNLLFASSTLSSSGLTSHTGSMAKSVALRQALLGISERVNNWEDELMKCNNELKQLEGDLSRDISYSAVMNHEARMYGNSLSPTKSQQESFALTPYKSDTQHSSVYNSARKTLHTSVASTDDAVMDIITHGAPLSNDLVNALRQGVDTVFDVNNNRTSSGLTLSDCEFSLYEVMSGQAGVMRMNGESPKLYIMRLQKRLSSLLTLELQIQLEFQAKVTEVKHGRDLLREVEIKRLRVELQLSNVTHTLQQSQLNHSINVSYHNNMHSTGDSTGDVTLIHTPGPAAARPVLLSSQHHPQYVPCQQPQQAQHTQYVQESTSASPVQWTEEAPSSAGKALSSPRTKRAKGSKLGSPTKGVQRVVIMNSPSRPVATTTTESAVHNHTAKVVALTGRAESSSTSNATAAKEARRPAPLQAVQYTDSDNSHAHRAATSAQLATATTPSASKTSPTTLSSGTKNTTYQESAYHAEAILSDIIQHQTRRFSALQDQDSAQEEAFFSPAAGGGAESGVGNTRNTAGKSPSTKEIHRLIIQYMHDHHLDPHVHYAGIIKAIKIQVLSQLLQRDLSHAEVKDTAHLISVSSPTPVGVPGSNRLQRYFSASDTPISPIPLSAEYAQYARDDKAVPRSGAPQSSSQGPQASSALSRREGSPQQQQLGSVEINGDGSESNEESGNEGEGASHTGPKRSTTPKKFQFPNARKAAPGASKKMWVSALHADPKVDYFLTPQPDRLQRLAAKALQSAVSGLSDVYKEDGNDLQSVVTSMTGSTGGGSRNSRSIHKLKHHSSVRRNCSCDSCRAASIQGESTDEYDYHTRYDRHGHLVNALGETVSVDPHFSHDFQTLGTVDESPRSSKGSLRTYPSPAKSTAESIASAEKGRKLSRNSMNVSFRSEVDMLNETAQEFDTDVNVTLLGQDSPVPSETGSPSMRAVSVFDRALSPTAGVLSSLAVPVSSAPSSAVSPYTPAQAERQTPLPSSPVRQATVEHNTSRPPRDSRGSTAPAGVMRREGSGGGHSGRKALPASGKPTAEAPRFSTSLKTAASPARHVVVSTPHTVNIVHHPEVLHTVPWKSSTAVDHRPKESSPPRFRFCVICSTLVSPQGTSSAAHTGQGMACAHPEHHLSNEDVHLQQHEEVKTQPEMTTVEATSAPQDTEVEVAQSSSAERPPSPLSIRPTSQSSDELPVPIPRSASPPRPERLSSPRRDVSPGRPRQVEQDNYDRDLSFGSPLRSVDHHRGDARSANSPARLREVRQPADYSAVDPRLAGFSLHPSTVAQHSVSAGERSSMLPGLFPQTFGPSPNMESGSRVDKTGMAEFKELMNMLVQQQKEIDALRQSQGQSQSMATSQSNSQKPSQSLGQGQVESVSRGYDQSHRENYHHNRTLGSPTPARSGTTDVGSTTQPAATLMNANLNLRSPHLKVSSSAAISQKSTASDQLQQQLSVSKPRLSGSTGQFNGNLTPSGTLRSHDSRHRGGDSPLSPPTTNLSTHGATRRESQGPHGLPHSETPVMTLPSQAKPPAAQFNTQETDLHRDFNSPVRNLAQLADGSPHLPDTRSNNVAAASHLPAPFPHQIGAEIPHLGHRSDRYYVNDHENDRQHVAATQVLVQSGFNPYASFPPAPPPPQRVSHNIVAPPAVIETTDATVLQILRCLRERIGKLQHRYQQTYNQERMHPQFNIALNADGTSRAYVEVSVISAKNLPIMKKQHNSCDAYIELQLITQFPTHNTAPNTGMHSMRVDTSTFLSGQVYNRLDLLYQAHNYAQRGWPAEGVNAHSLDTKVDIVELAVQFNAYGMTTIKGTLFPEWRETFKFPSLSYLPSQSLVFVVKDATYAGHQVYSQDSVVGYAVLPLSAPLLADQHPHVMWLTLLHPPHLRRTNVHKLREDCAVKVEVKIHFSEQEYWRHLLREAEEILHKVTSSLTAQQRGAQAASSLTAAEGRKLEKWLDAMVAAGAAAARQPPAPVLRAPHAPITMAAPPPAPSYPHNEGRSDAHQHSTTPHELQFQHHQPPPQPHAEVPVYSAHDGSHFRTNKVEPDAVPHNPVSAPVSATQQPAAVRFQGHVPLEQRPHHQNYAQAVHTSRISPAPALPLLPLTLSDPALEALPQKDDNDPYRSYQEELQSPMGFSAISSVTNSPTAPASSYQQSGGFFGSTQERRALNTPGATRQNLYPATPLVQSANRTRKHDISNEVQADTSRSDSATKGRLKIVGLREQSNRDLFYKTLRTDSTTAKKPTSKPLGISAVPLPAEMYRTPAAAHPSTDHRVTPASRGFSPPPLPIQQLQIQAPARGQGNHSQNQGQRAPTTVSKSRTKDAPPPLPIQTQALLSTPALPSKVDLSIFKRAGTDMVYQGEVRSDVRNKLLHSAQSRNEKLGFLSAGPKLLKF